MWWRWPMSIPSPPSSSSSPIPETPSVIMMGHWGPSISPWERGWGRGWCRGMRAKARALCQVTKAFQHNNSYQSLPEPVGLYGSLYGSSGMCRCLFMWRGFFLEGWWWWWRWRRRGTWLWLALLLHTFTQSSRLLSLCLHNRHLLEQQGKARPQDSDYSWLWIRVCSGSGLERKGSHLL